MAATGYGQGGDISRVAKTGDTMTGTLILTGNPATQTSAGAATGDVWTSDSHGNGSWQPAGAASGALLAVNNLSDVTSAGAARSNLGLGTAATQASSAFLQPGSNLSDVGSAATARANLGLGTAALLSSSAVAQTANNLSDLTSAAAARANLSLGSAALLSSGAILLVANNLSDVSSAGSARANLGLGSAATFASSAFAQTANNLSDLASAGTARTNLGLGTAALLSTAAVAQTANNLSDIASAGTARTNLGLGSAALLSSAAFAQTANNLSDLASAGTARTNLGLSGAATMSLPVAISNGGTAASAAQTALNNLAGSTSAGQYLRGNGSNVLMTAIQAADVPTLNQNTTGTSSNVTGIVAIANGGTGSSAQQTAINNLTGTQSSGKYLRSDGTNATLSPLLTADVPASSVDNYWLPGDHGLIGWSFDPATASGNTLPSNGVIQLVGLELRVAKTITNLLLNVTTAGSALTANANYAALYSSNGTMLASTGDQSSTWNSASLKTMALTAAQAVAAGMYWVGFVTNGATAPQFARGTAVGGASTMINAGLAASAARYATNGSAQTSLASVSTSANALGAVSWWAGVS